MTATAGRIRGRALLAGVTAAMLLAACGTGTGSGGPSGGELPDRIKLLGVRDLTGPVAYAGIGASRGGALAVEEINEQGYLGDGVTLSLEEIDTAGSIEQASSEMTKAMADQEVSAILGPAQSQQAATVAPMVEKRRVPTVFTQAGSEGVVIGDYTFRATPPMHTYYGLAAEYLADSGDKDVSLLFNATFPTFAELGQKQFPAMARENGLRIDASMPVQMTTQDFTTPARSITSAASDAVVMFLTESQSVTALKQLRQAGYAGEIVATSVQGGGNIAEAGRYGKGVVYPTNFSPAMETEQAEKFVESYRKRFGQEPDVYAAEGYDAVWWIARAIKNTGSASREDIQEGLQKVAATGFEGAQGSLTFEGNDVRVPGVLIEWDDARERLVNGGS